MDVEVTDSDIKLKLNSNEAEKLIKILFYHSKFDDGTSTEKETQIEKDISEISKKIQAFENSLKDQSLNSNHVLKCTVDGFNNLYDILDLKHNYTQHHLSKLNERISKIESTISEIRENFNSTLERNLSGFQTIINGMDKKLQIFLNKISTNENLKFFSDGYFEKNCCFLNGQESDGGRDNGMTSTILNLENSINDEDNNSLFSLSMENECSANISSNSIVYFDDNMVKDYDTSNTNVNSGSIGGSSCVIRSEASNLAIKNFQCRRGGDIVDIADVFSMDRNENPTSQNLEDLIGLPIDDDNIEMVQAIQPSTKNDEMERRGIEYEETLEDFIDSHYGMDGKPFDNLNKYLGTSGLQNNDFLTTIYQSQNQCSIIYCNKDVSDTSYLTEVTYKISYCNQENLYLLIFNQLNVEHSSLIVKIDSNFQFCLVENNQIICKYTTINQSIEEISIWTVVFHDEFDVIGFLSAVKCFDED